MYEARVERLIGLSPRCYIFRGIGPPVLEKKILSVFTIMSVAAIGSCNKDISNTGSMSLHKEVPHKNVQIGNDQEMAQSERNSHSTKFQVDRPSANVLVAQTCCDLSEIVDDDGDGHRIMPIL